MKANEDQSPIDRALARAARSGREARLVSTFGKGGEQGASGGESEAAARARAWCEAAAVPILPDGPAGKAWGGAPSALACKGNVVMCAPVAHVWAGAVELEAVAGAWAPQREREARGTVAVASPTVDRLPVAVALRSRGWAAGPLLSEVQGADDLAMARGMAARLAATMRRKGLAPSEATQEDGAGAGVLAVARWRAGEDGDGGAAGVCWRAVVREMSADLLGDSLSLSDITPEGLFGSALPLPGVHETREDRAARLLFERTRAARPGRLAVRMDWFRAVAGVKGKRRALLDRIQAAAGALLQGVPVDDAAQGAGFRPSGKGRGAVRAGDQFARAVRRLGVQFQFSARERGREDGERRGAFVPISSATVAAWSVAPSASLPLPGEGVQTGARRLQRIKRKLARWRTRTARQAARVALRSAVKARLDAKRRTAARKARRSVAKGGLWLDWSLSSVRPDGRGGARWL